MSVCKLCASPVRVVTLRSHCGAGSRWWSSCWPTPSPASSPLWCSTSWTTARVGFWIRRPRDLAPRPPADLQTENLSWRERRGRMTKGLFALPPTVPNHLTLLLEESASDSWTEMCTQSAWIVFSIYISWAFWGRRGIFFTGFVKGKKLQDSENGGGRIPSPHGSLIL